MLRAHLGADKPVETEPSCPEDGGAGPHPDTAVGHSPEDGRAEDMLVSGAQAQGCRPGGCGPRGYRRGDAVLEGCRPGCKTGGAEPGGAGLGGSILVLNRSYQSLPGCVLGTQLWNAPAPHPPLVTLPVCVGKVTGVWRAGHHAQASGALSAHPCAQKLCGISLHDLGVFRITPAGEEKKNTNLIHYGNAMTLPLFLEENEKIISLLISSQSALFFPFNS